MLIPIACPPLVGVDAPGLLDPLLGCPQVAKLRLDVAQRYLRAHPSLPLLVNLLFARKIHDQRRSYRYA